MCKGKKFLFIAISLICIASIAFSQETTQTVFKGRVVDAQGKPVAGATAKLYNEDSDREIYSFSISDVIEKTSNADGTFTFNKNTEGDEYLYGYVVVEKEGLALDGTVWNMDEDKEFEFKLSQPKELDGIVVDENGEPVAEAQVSILIFTAGEKQDFHGEPLRVLSVNVAPKILTTNTDAAGKFTFTNLPADANVEFLVQKEGKATISTLRIQSYPREPLQYSPGQEDIRIVQPEEAVIEGIVINKDSGKPVTGIQLVLRCGRNSTVYGLGKITSGENGEFSIRGLSADSYKLMYAAPREELADWVSMPIDITLETGQARKDIKVELSKGGMAEILVTESVNNKPLEGARASLYSERIGQSFGGSSDKEGIVRMRLFPGVYRSGYAYMEGYSTLDSQETITIEEGSTKRLEWQLSPKPMVSGIVRDENDKPIKGAVLVILPGGGNEVKSDSQGKYKIDWNVERLPDEEQEIPLLVCRYAEGNLATVVMVDAGTKTLDVKLEPGITIGGKVADPTGKPIADARITMMLRQTMWASTFIRNDPITTDSDGNFKVSAVPAEQRYQIIVSADGYGSREVEFHVDDAINNILDVNTVTLPIANLTVSGIVVDSEGNPLANTRIESYNFGGNQPDHLSTQTDSQGRFTFEGVCEGEFNIRVTATVNSKRISARAIAFGGASDIKIVATEGTSSPVQYFRSESYEEIVQNSENILAGIVVDEEGLPVGDVLVGVCCVKSEYEPGRYRWMFSDFSEFSTITDKQGRFAIPLDTDDERYKGMGYNLRISPQGYAADIVYDIPVGTKDVKVVLSKGGTLSGKLVRIEKGEKVPITNAEVKLEQESRASYTHLGFDRDQTAITDTQGRFKFEHIQTKIRPGSSRSDMEWEPIPRVWLISYGDVSESVAFYDSNTIDNFELIINPAASLLTVGNPIPGFDGIEIDLPEGQIKDKKILICFWDYQQRPSRNCIMQLSKKAQELKSQGIEIIAVHSSKIERETLNECIKENNIDFTVGMIQDNEQQIKVNWGVKSLPWLILTDKNHVVTAEGFSISELDEKISNSREKL